MLNIWNCNNNSLLNYVLICPVHLLFCGSLICGHRSHIPFWALAASCPNGAAAIWAPLWGVRQLCDHMDAQGAEGVPQSAPVPHRCASLVSSFPRDILPRGVHLSFSAHQFHLSVWCFSLPLTIWSAAGFVLLRRAVPWCNDWVVSSPNVIAFGCALHR